MHSFINIQTNFIVSKLYFHKRSIFLSPILKRIPIASKQQNLKTELWNTYIQWTLSISIMSRSLYGHSRLFVLYISNSIYYIFVLVRSWRQRERVHCILESKRSAKTHILHPFKNKKNQSQFPLKSLTHLMCVLINELVVDQLNENHSPFIFVIFCNVYPKA